MTTQRATTSDQRDSRDESAAPERAKFTALLAGNPNYFGTIPESEFPVVLPIAGNVTYEELTCVSLHPEQHLLEATVHVKQPFGYGGSLCQAGSREYVRFFLDYGSGVGRRWAEQHRGA